jgi:uncharacterized OsmC-like protein
MKITATISSTFQALTSHVNTDGHEQTIALPVRPDGYGSAISGGELLLTSMAVCYCNDIYREAARQKINLSHVAVTCTGEFPGEGKAGENFRYNVLVEADVDALAIAELILHTDQQAEVHLTIRKATPVEFEELLHDHEDH